MAKKKEETTILSKIKGTFKQAMLGNIIMNVLFLLLGVIIYLNPDVTAKTVGILIGIYFVLYGIFSIYEYLIRDIAPIFRLKVFSAIISVLLGIFIMANPVGTINVLTTCLGIYLIAFSVMKVMDALKFKSLGFDGWLLMFVISILLLVGGILVVVNPMASMDIIKVVGIFMILSSILEICNLLMLYGKAKDIEKLFLK